MYQAYDFTFAEESGSMHGMFVCDIGSNSHVDNSFGNIANIVETRLPNRITPLHFGVRYHDTPLQFTLIFGSEKPMDRYWIQEISQWLTGHQDYQWLSIDQPDMDYIRFRCLIQELTPISVGWLPVAFAAKIICDCSYGYSFPWEKSYTVTSSGLTTTLYNYGTANVNLKPDVTIALGSSVKTFSITNNTTGAAMSFTSLPAGGITIIADNENCVLRDSNDEYDLYDYFNFQFFNLAPGANSITMKGKSTVTISGMFLYNVGA